MAPPVDARGPSERSPSGRSGAIVYRGPMDARPVLELIGAAQPVRPFTFVGIGGRGGSGKTTLAARIAGAQVVGTDEFWDGEGFELSRLRARCSSRCSPAAPRATPAGIGMRDARGERADGGATGPRRRRGRLRAPPHVPGRLRRPRVGGGAVRDTACAGRRPGRRGGAGTWVERWMPMDDRYVERDDPVACADLVVDGAG